MVPAAKGISWQTALVSLMSSSLHLNTSLFFRNSWASSWRSELLLQLLQALLYKSTTCSGTAPCLVWGRVSWASPTVSSAGPASSSWMERCFLPNAPAGSLTGAVKGLMCYARSSPDSLADADCLPVGSSHAFFPPLPVPQFFCCWLCSIWCFSKMTRPGWRPPSGE